MKNLIKIFFVWIPLIVCVLIQLGLLMLLYSEEANNVATHAKWIFPLVLVISIYFQFSNKQKI
jgi:amino acid transporter